LVDFVKYIIFACFQVLKSKNIYFFNIHDYKGSVYGRGFLFPNLISNRSCILLKTQAASVCGAEPDDSFPASPSSLLAVSFTIL
jgi:hypothetical protein